LYNNADLNGMARSVNSIIYTQHNQNRSKETKTLGEKEHDTSRPLQDFFEQAMQNPI